MTNLEKNFYLKTGIEFSDFYKEQKPKLTWFLSKWTKCYETAEDFANEAFIKALNSIESFDSEISQPQTWLYTIAINFVKKDFKDRKKKQTTSLDKSLNNDSNLAMFIPYDDDDNKEIKEKTWMKKASIIKDAIYNLPDKQYKYKTVLILREIENMSYNEISEYLNINLSTIKSQIKKGREIIIDKVKKEIEKIDNEGIL